MDEQANKSTIDSGEVVDMILDLIDNAATALDVLTGLDPQDDEVAIDTLHELIDADFYESCSHTRREANRPIIDVVMSDGRVFRVTVEELK
jgi:trimethylamine:corrinoid methyltransferase-like protein